MNIMGVDPGASGGITIIDPEGHVIDCIKMPDTDADLCQLFRIVAATIRLAFIEAVHSMPGQGVASSFKFGANYGGLRMALMAHAIPMESVQPRTWQKEMKCLTGGDKNVSKRRAQELFPALTITHAIADSLLIAEYGRRITFHNLNEKDH